MPNADETTDDTPALRCEICGGHGNVFWDYRDPHTGENHPAQERCPNCRGFGLLMPEQSGLFREIVEHLEDCPIGRSHLSSRSPQQVKGRHS